MHYLVIIFIIVFEDLWILVWYSQFEMERSNQWHILILTLVINLKDIPIKFIAISGPSEVRALPLGVADGT